LSLRASGESKEVSESRRQGKVMVAATRWDDTARLVAIRPVTGRLQWKIFATFATVKAVAGTLLAFQPLGKMPPDVYMRLTEVLRLKLSLLLHNLSDANSRQESGFGLDPGKARPDAAAGTET